MPLLRSELTGNILRFVIYIFLSILLARVLFSFVVIMSPSTHLPVSFRKVVDTLNVAYLMFVALVPIMYIIWMYKLHNDMRAMNDGYPVSAGTALLHLLIPLFNLYGIAKVHYTLAKNLGKNSLTSHLQKPIVRCLILWYIFHFLTSFITLSNNTLLYGSEILLIHDISLLLMHVFILLGYRYMSKGLHTLFDSSKETEQEQKEEEQDQHAVQISQ
jgi:hypothetical protein